MARAELMLDLAAYKQALQQARPALQAPGRDQPPSPGCQTKARSPGWYPGLGHPRLASQPPTVVAPVLPSQSLNLEVGSPFPHVEGSALQALAPSPGQLTVPEPFQHFLTRRAPPRDSPPFSLAEPSALMLAMFSLLETMAPHSHQVPDTDFDSLWKLVVQTYSKRC